MADTTPSPNMGMPVPTVATAPGPDWATDVNASLSVVDGHDHSSGNGVPVTPNGMNINADLTFGGNNAYTLRSVRFSAQNAALAGAADLGCLYEAGVDLYYNDGNGNQVRITQGGAITGAAGTITGLPSGTASAAYSAGTFTFLSATSTPAVMSVGPIKIARNSSGAKGVTVSANASQTNDYSITLPQSLPGGAYYMTLDNTGAIAVNPSGYTGSGQVVLDASPAIDAPIFSGSSTGTITSGTYAPTVTAGLFGTGQTAVANSFSYMRINNRVAVYGWLTGTTSAGEIIYNVSMPINPTSNFSAPAQAVGVVTGTYTSTVLQATIIAITSTKTAKVTVVTSGGGTDVVQTFISFNYDCT